MQGTKPFVVFSVTYPILRCILGHTNDQQCQLMTQGFQVCLLASSWHEYVQQCYQLYVYVTQLSTS